jgi:hypothetical protein
MSDGISGASVFHSSGAKGEQVSPEVRILRAPRRWDPEVFAREQIRGLVRQIFFSNALRPVRQVVFSPTEQETDVQNLCRRVGHALALETSSSVAVVCGHPLMLQDVPQDDTEQSHPARAEAHDPTMPLRTMAVAVKSNLWLVPALAEEGDSIPDSKWHAHLCDVRREFEYSVVEGPPAGASNEAMAMAQLADGIVLVLSARHTRRATARSIKERLELAQVRLLGAVLSDRVFPIPESLYRRL